MVKRFLFFARCVDATLAQAARWRRCARLDKYIAIQNAHDLKSMRSLLADTPDFLWSAGKPIWGGGALRTRGAVQGAGVSMSTRRSANHFSQSPGGTSLRSDELPWGAGAERREPPYINLMWSETEGWQIVSILPSLSRPSERVGDQNW